MADSRKGGRTWYHALNTICDVEPTIYPASVDIPGAKDGWLCRVENSCVTAGYGRTPEEAYVDFIEECWCLMGSFPKGYPD